LSTDVAIIRKKKSFFKLVEVRLAILQGEAGGAVGVSAKSGAGVPGSKGGKELDLGVLESQLRRRNARSAGTVLKRVQKPGNRGKEGRGETLRVILLRLGRVA